MENYNINFKEILDFLQDYSGCIYNRPDNIKDEKEKQKFTDIKNKAKSAIEEFKKIGKYLTSDKIYTFDDATASKWLEGSNTKVRSYFWIELKKSNKKDYISSISIFAEKTNEEVRFRVVLEAKDKNSNKEDYDKHNRFLDIINYEEGFEYLVFRKNNSEIKLINRENIGEYIKKIKDGEDYKIQIGKTIPYEQINNSKSDEILKIIKDTINSLAPYYNKAVEDDDNGVIYLDMNLNDFRNLVINNDEYKRKIKEFRDLYAGATDWILCCIFGGVKSSKKHYIHIMNNPTNIETSIRQNVSRYFQNIGYEIKDENGNSKEKTRIINDEMNEFMNKVYKCKKLYEAINLLKDEMKRLNNKSEEENKKIDEVDKFIKCLKSIKYESNIDNISIYDKNMILYGPPGTGKTYNTIIYALGIIENKKIDDLQNDEYEELYERYKKFNEEGRIKFITFHQSYGYEEFIEGIKPTISIQSNTNESDIKYEYVDGVFKKFCKKAEEIRNERCVFIIDEINRGNISKIFGELITLIEQTKRLGELEETMAVLPYTSEKFGVPNNVYILGTMNTADRSIALMDTALRRRFKFIEMMPNADILKDLNINGDNDLNISKVLEVINQRIEYLYDREHTIGHAYFISLYNNPTIEKLASIFENSIIPLLQEYFYEDYSKIQLVLGDNEKEDQYKFILDSNIKTKDIFKGNPDIDLSEKKYTIQKQAFLKSESYRKIYERGKKSE